MYGFGDDRNPSNDTVNVMEEILIEYIIDVVRHPFRYHVASIRLRFLATPPHIFSVSKLEARTRSRAYL